MPPRKRKPAARAKKPAGPDPALAAARVDVVLRLRLDGAQLHDVLGFSNDLGDDADKARGGPPWGLTPAAAEQLCDRADALLVARAEQKRDRAYAMAVARREALYARAVNAGDYSAALACLRDIAQLQGTYPKVAELVKLIKEQDAALRELEADGDRPRLTGAAGEEADGEGAGLEAGEAREAGPVGG